MASGEADFTENFYGQAEHLDSSTPPQLTNDGVKDVEAT